MLSFHWGPVLVILIYLGLFIGFIYVIWTVVYHMKQQTKILRNIETALKEKEQVQ